jgi:hypothetical protein
MFVETCPHCGKNHVAYSSDAHARVTPNENWHLGRCQNPDCGRVALIQIANSIVKVLYPLGSYTLNSSAQISQAIRDDFQEAGQCLAAGCPKASMVMSRRALQRILKEQGCGQHNLVDAIDHAIKQGIVRKQWHPMLEEIRKFGNLGAHPDDDQLVNCTPQNAGTLLGFVRHLIEELYELPHRAGQLKFMRENP